MHIRLIATVSALALGLHSGAALAQQEPTDSAPSGDVASSDTGTPTGEDEEIVVTGIRGSLIKSIQAKRNSDVVADIISAEDIGKFPDKNVAEALQRVPGIVINREFGEGERVSLRGTAPNLTKTLVNGHAIATADWFILEQLAATRSFNYLTLPAEIVGQLDVYKSPQADVEEGGIGGTINVHTRDPLDLDAWTLSASAQAVYTEKSDKFDPQVSGLVSWKNASETFGILVGGVYQKRRIRRDGIEVLGYQNVVTGGQTAQIPALIGSALFEQERERFGGNVGIQFKPADTLEINLTGLYSRFNANNFNQNYLAWTSNALGGGGTLTNATVANGLVTRGTVNSVPGGRAVVFDAIDRQAYAETYSGDLDVNYTPSDRTTLHIKVGYTKANGNTDSQPFYEGGAPGGFTFDLTGNVPQVGFIGVNPADPADLVFDFASLHRITNSDKEKYGYVDFEQAIQLGALTAIKVGGKYTDHDRVTRFLATTYGGFFLPLLASGCGGPCTSAFFAGDPTPDDFLDGTALPGTLTNYFQIDRNRLRNTFAALPASVRARVLNPPENYSINEKTYGGYAMARFEAEGVRGNFGMRVIRTEQRSRGNILGVPAGPGTVNDNPFGIYQPIEVTRAYTDYLPSLNVTVDLAPGLVGRFAAGRTVTRPDYTDIVPRVSLNPGSLSGDGGDPLINPYRATQLDLSLEWYPDRETIFAIAGYAKDLDSYIVNRTQQQIFPIETSTPNVSRCTKSPGNNPVLYDCLFEINRRSNGSGGTNLGVEVQGTRRLFGGFGAQVNYTYSDAKSDGGDPIPGNSKHALNVSGFYEDDRISARLSYNYRSKFFINIDRATPLNQTATESLDASLNFKLTDAIAVTADAVNLTNHKIRQFSGTPDRFRAIYDNGRIYYVGARLRY